MKYHTIRPLLVLLKHTAARGEVKDGDLAQTEARVQNIRRAKLAQAMRAQSTIIEDKYLEIINELRTYFRPFPKIPHETLILKCNEIIEREKLYYIAAESDVLQDSLFYPSSARGKLIKTHEYDIAFYNELTQPGYHEGHSSDNDLKAVFYIRVEETKDSLLIGNMQIDWARGGKWSDRMKEKIMLSNKNLYLQLVQNAVVALIPKKKKLIFQAGDAAAVAQWGYCFYKHIEITKKNHKHYQKLYETASARFAALRVGDSSLENSSEVNLVIEKKDDYYKRYQLYPDGPNSGSLLAQVEYQIMYETKHNEKRIIKNIMRAAQQKDPAQALRIINKAFRALGIPVSGVERRAEKTAYLQEMFAQHKIKSPQSLCMPLDKFFLKFEYGKLFLKKYRCYKKIDTRHNPKVLHDYCFIDKTHPLSIQTFYKKSILRPEVGKTFRVDKNKDYDFLCFHIRPDDEESYLTCNWYDQDLPKLLTKLGLEYKITPLHTRGFGTMKIPLTHCQGYEITGGIPEFESRPLISFSAADGLKTDYTTLPQLELAAAKFGLPREQLKLVNDWLISSSTHPFGWYNNRRSTLYLNNHSLSTLAHEGLHHMVNCGLIPQAEYQALVTAGAEVISQAPAWQRALNKSDRYGRPLYPPGSIRDEECAAIFIENYYTQNARARQGLLNENDSLIGKFIEYVHDIIITLRALLGSQPALAQAFLRRVEKGALLSEPARENFPIRRTPLRRRMSLGLAQ